MVYQWRTGEFAGDRSRAQVIGETLERLRAEADGGILAAQDVVVAPLPLDAVGPELAEHDPAVGLQLLEHRANPVGAHAEVPGNGRASS